ncbi:hypothetical protein GCM10028803_53190 [Larkinella knui]|uniref:Uncharacterized protein n=1 Tax=Larkinella knui TaxID=2025310 RepID=A0A3P1CGU2_9BACT|nr:hypothetical protein [Larkinella knui]RRB12475.1 hypothetical protein EHT87_19950 [Larkinella knui]
MELSPQKADRLERFRDHLHRDAPLADKDQLLMQRYNFAYTQLCEGESSREVVALLMKVYALSQSQAYNIVNDALAIFGGNPTKAIKEGKKVVYVIRLEELADKLDEEGEYEAAANVLAKAAKLQGMTEKEGQQIDPRLFMPKPNLIFTDDLQAVEITRHIEDAEHDVVD